MLIEVDDPQTQEARIILKYILPPALNLFLAKNKDYDIPGINIAQELGTRGQWADMYRKIAKLKQSMWEKNGEGLEFETAEQVLYDLLGHVLLALKFLAEEGGVTWEEDDFDPDDENDVEDRLATRAELSARSRLNAAAYGQEAELTAHERVKLLGMEDLEAFSEWARKHPPGMAYSDFLVMERGLRRDEVEPWTNYVTTASLREAKS